MRLSLRVAFRFTGERAVTALLLLAAALTVALGSNLVLDGSFEVTAASSSPWRNFVSSEGKSYKSPKCRIPDSDCKSMEYCAFSERDAAPDGKNYAVLNANAAATEQVVLHAIVPHAKYTLRVWARGINRPWGGYGVKPAPASPVLTAVAVNVQLKSAKGGKLLGEIKSAKVGYPSMKGYAASRVTWSKSLQDDGANVFFKDGVRMHIAGYPLWQEINKDPILDEWKASSNVPPDFLEDQMAAAPVVIPRTGQQAIGGTEYETDTDEIFSRLVVNILGGKAPNNLKITSKYKVLANEKSNSEYPWVIDSHYFYDKEEDRMWMSWGGHEIWVTEVSTQDLRVCCSPRCATKCASTEFSDHGESVHTKILSWDGRDLPDFAGDACSMPYMEGPALWKHTPSGNWFAFASWGNMGVDYTIRVCRSTTGPRGPYKDKNGINCMQYENNMFGSSMLLGPEGKESVPGHPHLWKENGVTYMGYDYRVSPPGPTKSNGQEGFDFMAIRKLHWVTDADGASGVWPTIWQPLEITFNSDDFGDQAGDNLVVSISNKGEKNSQAAADYVSLEYEMLPTAAPTTMPTERTTKVPSREPTQMPVEPTTSAQPTQNPTATRIPTADLTRLRPTRNPTLDPTAQANSGKDDDDDENKKKNENESIGTGVIAGAAAGAAAVLAAVAFAVHKGSTAKHRESSPLFDPAAEVVEMSPAPKT